VERRQSEPRELLQWLDQTLPEDAPNVLMGDFNAVPTAQEIRWLLAEDYVDTWARMHGSEPGFTWDPNLNLNIQIHYHLPEPDAPVPWHTKLNAENEQIRKRIDYIFVKNVPPGYIQRSEIVFEQPVNGLHPSDHFGVLAVIRFDLTQ